MTQLTDKIPVLVKAQIATLQDGETWPQVRTRAVSMGREGWTLALNEAFPEGVLGIYSMTNVDTNEDVMEYFYGTYEEQMLEALGETN